MEGLPEVLEVLGEDQPVRGEPMGWGELELGRLTLGVLADGVRVGAGRPLMIEFDPELRVGVEVRVGVADERVGVTEGREVEGLELVRVGDELTLRDGVERVDGLDRRTLLVRWGVDRLVVVRCEVARELDALEELVALEEVERCTVRWAGSGCTARESEPLNPMTATAAAALSRRRARRLRTRLGDSGRQFMGFSVDGRWGDALPGTNAVPGPRLCLQSGRRRAVEGPAWALNGQWLGLSVSK